MKKWCVFLTIYASSLPCIVFAQDKQVTKEQQPKSTPAKEKPTAAKANPNSQKQPVIKFSMAMLENDRIDPKYTGFSVEKIITAIEYIMPKRGEFESTTDYNTRKSAALTSKLLAGSRITDFFAFVAPVEKFVSYDPQFSYTYNADTGNVNLYTLPSPTSPYERGQSADDVKQVIEKMDTFTTQKKTLSNSKYLATNAFGAKTVVNKTVSTNVGIAANKIPFLKFEREIIYDTQDSQAIIAHQFKMNNTEAATELPALKVLIVMKLTAPYIVYDLSRFEPTRDIPIDSTVMERYLTGDVLGIVYYSGRTGHIFARLPENFGISTPDTTPNDKQNL